MGSADDAGVYSLGDGRVLVQTIDIFTPVIDSAYDWGRVAAANALSDVYAMGAVPLTALQYLAWPRDELPFELGAEVIRGGMDLMAQADCTVVGGHSVDSPEPAYGFAVTGLAAGGRILANSGARPGDLLLLTKPLGIGVITTAIKRGKCPPDLERRVIEVMTTLNDRAGAALTQAGAHAATDVTGFGLLGHLGEVCRASSVGALVRGSQVPVLEGAGDLLEAGMWPGGSQRNLEDVRRFVDTETDLRLLADAQTSGGLLVVIAPQDADQYLELVAEAVPIGEIVPGERIRVV